MLIPFGIGVSSRGIAPAGERTASPPTRTESGSGEAMTAPRPNPSLPARPAWITSDTPFTGYCTDGEPLRCVGVSLLRPSKELGRIDATEAALDALAAFAGERIQGGVFDDHVRPAYENVRQGLAVSLAALATKGDNIPVDDPIVRKLADARHRAAEVLRADVGSILPVLATDWYWEEYANEPGAGSSYIVYIEYAFNEAQLATLIETYTSEDTSRVVAAFPLLAFAFDDFKGGLLDVQSLMGSTAPGALRRAIIAAPRPPTRKPG
jgi:hypothetical protein